MAGKRRWLASERIAFRVLEEMGYRILEAHKRIIIDGIEVGEVDAVALGPDGETYAVEVKAGRLDVTGVRQVYVNAKLLNARPMAVAKGFADEAAKKLAEELGVKVVELSDVFLVDAEELENIVADAVTDTITEVLRLLLDQRTMPKPQHLELLKAVAASPTIEDAAKRLGVDVRAIATALAELRRTGLIPPWATRSWHRLRAIASLLLLKVDAQGLASRVEALALKLERILEALEKIV